MGSSARISPELLEVLDTKLILCTGVVYELHELVLKFVRDIIQQAHEWIPRQTHRNARSVNTREITFELIPKMLMVIKDFCLQPVTDVVLTMYVAQTLKRHNISIAQSFSPKLYVASSPLQSCSIYSKLHRYRQARFASKPSLLKAYNVFTSSQVA